MAIPNRFDKIIDGLYESVLPGGSSFGINTKPSCTYIVIELPTNYVIDITVDTKSWCICNVYAKRESEIQFYYDKQIKNLDELLDEIYKLSYGNINDDELDLIQNTQMITV